MTSAAGGGSAAESGGPGGAGATAPMVQKARGTEDTAAHGSHGRMAELIPRRVLFGNPERISPRISPDASTLAWIAPHEGVLNVWTAPVGPDGVDWATARVVTDDTERGIRMFTWAHDGRHLLYLQDTGGDENWRLHDVDLATMQRRDLTPFEGVRAELIATEKKFPTDILVGLNRDNPQLDDDDRIWLIGFTNDTGPVPFYAYDRQSRQGRFLFEHQPELSRYELAPMEPV